MNFLTSTPKQLTGIQINSWINNAKINMENAKANFDYIKGWITMAQDNPDYDQEDIAEVVTEVGKLRDYAISLTE